MRSCRSARRCGSDRTEVVGVPEHELSWWQRLASKLMAGLARHPFRKTADLWLAEPVREAEVFSLLSVHLRAQLVNQCEPVVRRSHAPSIRRRRKQGLVLRVEPDQQVRLARREPRSPRRWVTRAAVTEHGCSRGHALSERVPEGHDCFFVNSEASQPTGGEGDVCRDLRLLLVT